MVNRDYTIKSKDELKQIANALNDATDLIFGQVREAGWGCVLELVFVSGDSLKIGIRQGINKTELELYSDGEYGVNYGSMQSENLGQVLEALVD